MSSLLLDRLHAIRRTIRRRLLGYGFCAVLAGGVVSFLTVVTLDWLLWLPMVLRMLVAILFAAGFIAAATYWIIIPLRARLGVEQVAAKLERYFGELNDRLSSTVNFLNAGDAGSSRMVQEVVSHTDRFVGALPLETALSRRPLANAGATFLLAAVAFLTILSWSPDWVRTGLARYVHPFNGIEWPRSVSIVPLTGTELVAVGESVTLRMAVERGWHENLRGVAHLRDPAGEVTARTMLREVNGEFAATIDAVTEDLSYWFEAGDDTTQDRLQWVRVVRRPEVVEALATVEPPAYALHRPLRIHDLRDGPVRAPLGGIITLAVHTSKPIAMDDAQKQAGLRGAAGEWMPLEVVGGDRQRLSARFPVMQSLNFRVELVDDNGFENQRATLHSLIAVPDHPPTVTVVEPQAVLELTPQASLRLVIRVEDDFGIARLELQASRTPTGEIASRSLTDRLVISATQDGVEALAEYAWDLQPLGLAPGDSLTYTVAATDNRGGEEAEGQVSRSAVLRVKVISDAEFDGRVRDEIARLQAGVRQIVLEEADVRDQTLRLARPDTEFAGLTALEREQALALAAQQQRLSRLTRETAGRSTQLHRRMEQNRAGDEIVRGRIQSIGEKLQQLAAGVMTAAGVALHASLEPADASSQHAALDTASHEESSALEQLRQVLLTLSQWGDFQGLLAKTRDLLDRQDELRGATAELGKSILGKPVESLSDTEDASLKRTQRLQDQLAGDVEQLLEHMNHLLSRAREDNPSGAEAIDAALRAARSQEVVKRLHAAAEAIAVNRTASAALDQQAAVEAMRRIVTILRRRENRELELLKKQVSQAEDQLAELIEGQRGLRAATQEAGQVGAESSVFHTLEENQQTLRRNTRFLGEEIAENERLVGAAHLVRQSLHPMAEAESHLNSAEPALATGMQDQALQLLLEAFAQLQALAQEVADASMRRSLGQIRDNLETILTNQQAVNTGLSQLREAMTAQGRMTRAEARDAAKLAREQLEVRQLLQELAPDLEKVPVYEWALRRTAEWMDTSSRWLDARKIDDDLTTTTRRIARELEKLIQAIRETEALPTETEFAEAEGGGSGEGQSLGLRPVPTVAELLVLRAMQQDVNERTGTLHQSLDVENANEGQLRELKAVGEDQAQVRRLTELVTARARQP